MAVLAAAIPMVVTAGSTVLSAYGKYKAGKSAKKTSYMEAAQLEDRAGDTRASSQREAIEQRRQARLLESRGLAIAAKSGGGVGDPTVVNLLADIGAEGEYRALTAMYEGETEARGLEEQARIRRKEGKAAKTAGIIGGISSILSAAPTIFDEGETLANKYW